MITTERMTLTGAELASEMLRYRQECGDLVRSSLLRLGPTSSLIAAPANMLLATTQRMLRLSPTKE